MKHTDELLAWYMQRSRKEAQAEADLLQALRDVAQLLAWQNNGESRGYSHRILTPEHALTLARDAIAKSNGGDGMRLRWKKDKAATGVRRINSYAPGSRLHDGTKEYARVWQVRAPRKGAAIGWGWWANCYEGFAKSKSDAKAAAMAFVQDQLKNAGGKS